MSNYLNYNQCEVKTGLTSSSSCNTSTSIGVTSTALGTKGGISAITINASGICTSVTMNSGRKLFVNTHEPETVLFKETGLRSKNGNTTYTQTLSFTQGSWDEDIRNGADVLTRTQSEGFVTLTNGNTYLIGVFTTSNIALGTGLKLTKNEWTSGQNSDDELSGVSIELVGKGGIKAIRVADSVLSSGILG